MCTGAKKRKNLETAESWFGQRAFFMGEAVGGRGFSRCDKQVMDQTEETVG